MQGCRVIAMCAALCNNVTTAPNDKTTVRQLGPYCVTSLTSLKVQPSSERSWCKAAA